MAVVSSMRLKFEARFDAVVMVSCRIVGERESWHGKLILTGDESPSVGRAGEKEMGRDGDCSFEGRNGRRR